MSFVSTAFLLFLAIVWLVYVAVGSVRWQNLALLVASYVFYGWWDPRFLGLIFLSSVLDFFLSRWAHPGSGRGADARRRAVLASASANLAILGLFKYHDFFAGSLMDAARGFGLQLDLPLLEVVLPVGISFYTFQTLGYTIDAYRGDVEPPRRFVDFMLYVSFFPQLVAGPIERGSAFMPQVETPRTMTWEKLSSGGQLMLVGFAKKMVVADNLAAVVNQVYGAPAPSGGAVALATWAFAFQIYCDFSGYTDIARGTARLFGFELRQNFHLPYFATSPADFWRRWHISLSTWLRDYLYVPLGGNRRGPRRTLVNLVLTMLLGGLWHGARWNFVAWGLYHGFLLVGFRLLSRGRATPAWSPLWLLEVVGFFQLTSLGWLLFRADDLGHALRLLGALFTEPTLGGVTSSLLVYPLLLIPPFVAFQAYQARRDDMEPWRHWPAWGRASFYLACFYAIVLLGAPVTNAFIYFQF